MKNALIVVAVSMFTGATGLLAQDFDFKTLDKLGTNAKSTANITLDSDTLKLASAFLGNSQDAADVKSAVAKLKGIFVRSYEFDKPGQYDEADLKPLRELLKQPAWKNIVDVREGKESTQIYMLQPSSNKLGGLAIISTEPTEVTVVYINGTLDVDDLQKLGGTMGIPEIKGLPNEKNDKEKNDKMDKKTGK